MKAEIGIIGGTGLYRLIKGPEITLSTPYGKSPEILLAQIKGRKVAFMPRHGKGHAVPPHKINFRANIWAFKKLGVERILAVNSVGAINPKYKPGDFVIVNDFTDFTKQRIGSFYYEKKVIHIDVTEPYCPELRKILFQSAKKVSERVFDGGIYVCTEGPRFETSSEIQMFKKLGFDVVGMTGVPEVVLAKEAEMCYATICTVTNYSAGLKAKKLTADEVLEVMSHKENQLRVVFENAIEKIPKKRDCPCKYALEGAKV